jgi:hypothetical protein
VSRVPAACLRPIDGVLIWTTLLKTSLPTTDVERRDSEQCGFQHTQIPVFLFPTTQVRILESRSI